MIKGLAVVVAVVSCLVAGAQAQGGFGLSFYVPHNVSTIAISTNTWTGAFKAPLTTGLKGDADWAAFCVDVGESCYVEPSSEITTGNYTTAKEKIDFEVIGLTANTNYWCYVATVLPKAMVCSKPVPVKTAPGSDNAARAPPSAPREIAEPAKTVEEPPKKVVAPPPPKVKKPANKVVAAAPAPEVEKPVKKVVAAPVPEVKKPVKKVVVAAPAPEMEEISNVVLTPNDISPVAEVSVKVVEEENKVININQAIDDEDVIADDTILV